MLEDFIFTFCKVPDSKNEDIKVDEAQDCKKVTFLWWRHNPRFAQKLEDCTGQLIISKCCALLTILPPSSGTQSGFLNEGCLSAEGVAAYHCLLIEASVMRIVVEVGQSTINQLLEVTRSRSQRKLLRWKERTERDASLPVVSTFLLTSTFENVRTHIIFFHVQ